ncbi:M56 family metallopeptidase, partial [Longimicrobium sp.]|uniref:M56 family metallopeptidase n=1 Tax=Longimicrobium sp. TaxID=2029185 RepID=UPI002F91D295
MIASWMLYALLVSLLLAAAAWTLEEVFRLRGLAVRFVWLGALLATVAITAAAPLRSRPAVVLQATQSSDVAVPRERPAPQGLAAWAAASLRAARMELNRGLDSAAALGGRAGTGLALGWIALSSLMLALTAATLLRSRRARRGWPVAELSGERVRVAPAAGPAVLGIRRPEVVVPAWLLGASPREQRLVVIHEREHVRARDPLVLLVGCVAAAVMAWNPAAWWMLRRLRAAVELDCDARVLRHGVRPQEYGAVLIDIAGRGPGLSLGAPALAGSPSILERRLRAMTMRLPRYARLRASLFGVLATAALASACEAPLPTSAEIEKMDVADVEARVGELALASGGSTTYIVDGKQVTAEEARALSGDRIERIEVTRGATGTPTSSEKIEIFTILAPPSDSSVRLEAGGPTQVLVDELVPSDVTTTGTRATGTAPAEPPTASGDTRMSNSGQTSRLETTRATSGESHRVTVRGTGSFEGLLLIDGVETPASAMSTLDPHTIESIDVLKGEAAVRAYSDPRAAH